MKKILTAIVMISLFSCGQTEVKMSEQLSNSVMEKVVDADYFSVYKVKVDSVEYLIGLSVSGYGNAITIVQHKKISDVNSKASN
jgi:hypothetical protein